MEITFWKDNKISGEHKLSVSQIIEDFKKSELFVNYENGWPFERSLLAFMMSYGSFERITDEEWDALHEEINKES